MNMNRKKTKEKEPKYLALETLSTLHAAIGIVAITTAGALVITGEVTGLLAVGVLFASVIFALCFLAVAEVLALLIDIATNSYRTTKATEALLTQKSTTEETNASLQGDKVNITM